MSDYMKEAERLLAEHEQAAGLCRYEDCQRTRAALLAHIQRGAVPKGWQVVHCTPMEHEGQIVYEHTDEPIPNADGFVLYAAPAPDRFRAAAKMMAVQPACMTCSGHGMVGGLLPNGGGYESDPCPDCAAPAPADDTVVLQPYGVRAKTFDPAFVESLTASAPAEVPMPEPVAYGFGNTAITGHTNRLMMVRLDVPLDDQYAGALWLPIVLADEAQTYGAACRAAGEAAGYARGLRDAGRPVE